MIARTAAWVSAAALGIGAMIMAMADPGPCASWSSIYGELAGDVIVDQCVILDTDATATGVEITPTGLLRFDRTKPVTLEVDNGSVIVRGGELEMYPGARDLPHTLRFINIDESTLPEGGGMSITDHPGLWFVDGGVWDARGDDLVPWTTGTTWEGSWKSGERIAIAPSGCVRDEPGCRHVDPSFGEVGVTAYPGDDGDHPLEVANLTRSVRVEGTPGGRAHIIFLGPDCARQTIEYVSIRYVAPGPLGRYGLHWHHCGDTSRGTVVRGVVVEDAGTHSYVPHASHGITIEDSIAVSNAGMHALWWDPDTTATYPQNATHDFVWRRGLVMGVLRRGMRLGQGTGNVIVDSAVVGTRGTLTHGAYEWPSDANHQPNEWIFRRNYAHNIGGDCVRVWQNDTNPHDVISWRSWRCRSGLLVGAYRNEFRFHDAIIEVDGGKGIIVQAQSRAGAGRRIRVERIRVDGADTPIYVGEHALAAQDRMLISDIEIVGATTSAPVVIDDGGREKSIIDLRRVTVDGAGLDTADIDVSSAHPDTALRLERRDGSAWAWSSASGWTPIADGAVSADWGGVEP